MSDRDLQALAEGRFNETGKWATIDELVRVSGGCQRQRAVSAISAAKLATSQRSLEMQVTIPPEVELGIRRLYEQWHFQSLSQWAPIHASLVHERDAARATIASMTTEHLEEIANLLERIGNLESSIETLTLELSAAQERSIRLDAIASERERILSKLEISAAPQ